MSGVADTGYIARVGVVLGAAIVVVDAAGGTGGTAGTVERNRLHR